MQCLFSLLFWLLTRYELHTSMQYAINTTPKLECYKNYNFHQCIDLEIIKIPCRVITFWHNLCKNNDVCSYLSGIGLALSTDALQQFTKHRPYYNIFFKFLIFFSKISNFCHNLSSFRCNLDSALSCYYYVTRGKWRQSIRELIIHVMSTSHALKLN